MNLQEYLTKRKIKSKDFAKKVGASLPAVHKWRLGTRIPRPVWMAKISRATHGKVQPQDWY